MNITTRDIQLNLQYRAEQEAQAEQMRIAQSAQQQTTPNMRNVIHILSQIVIK